MHNKCMGSYGNLATFSCFGVSLIRFAQVLPLPVFHLVHFPSIFLLLFLARTFTLGRADIFPYGKCLVVDFTKHVALCSQVNLAATLEALFLSTSELRNPLHGRYNIPDTSFYN